MLVINSTWKSAYSGGGGPRPKVVAVAIVGLPLMRFVPTSMVIESTATITRAASALPQSTEYVPLLCSNAATSFGLICAEAWAPQAVAAMKTQLWTIFTSAPL